MPEIRFSMEPMPTLLKSDLCRLADDSAADAEKRTLAKAALNLSDQLDAL